MEEKKIAMSDGMCSFRQISVNSVQFSCPSEGGFVSYPLFFSMAKMAIYQYIVK